MQTMIMKTAALSLVVGLALTGCEGGPFTSQGRDEGRPEPEITNADDDVTVYLHAIQAFSPKVDWWRVDGEDLSYKQVNCLGRKIIDATGTLGPDEDGVREVTWDEANPLAADGGEVSGLQSQLEINENHLVEEGMPDDDRATSDIEPERDRFLAMCKEAGETVADF
ncbi:MAG: hypothetical protein ACTH2Q_01480 [Propionibacteriaceae bacterium]